MICHPIGSAKLLSEVAIVSFISTLNFLYYIDPHSMVLRIASYHMQLLGKVYGGTPRILFLGREKV
ncbi:MAG TPA: hypothetical protein VE595_03190 [Nitrososphaeraceae archaeon]|nr:hypothetical protein [Nitrososphaeraceae archaeon]